MRHFNEFCRTPVGIMLGVALSILLFLTGLGIVNVMTGPSWAEICVSKGGEYNINPTEEGSYEWCDQR